MSSKEQPPGASGSIGDTPSTSEPGGERVDTPVERVLRTDSLQSQLGDEGISTFRRYQQLAIGTDSVLYLIRFELIMLLVGPLPGALGLLLRKWLFPSILGSVGRGVVFGRGMSIRHGPKIHVADGVVFDDGVTLDAKGGSNRGIRLGEQVIVSRNVTLACKNGDITIGARSVIGINSVVHASEGSGVFVGDDVLVGAFAYLVGSGGYGTDALDVPFKQQGLRPRGGVHIEDNVWIGGGAQVLDGVRIGSGAIVGSQALVHRDVAGNDVVGGVPSRLIRTRGREAASSTGA